MKCQEYFPSCPLIRMGDTARPVPFPPFSYDRHAGAAGSFRPTGSPPRCGCGAGISSAPRGGPPKPAGLLALDSVAGSPGARWEERPTRVTLCDADVPAGAEYSPLPSPRFSAGFLPEDVRRCGAKGARGTNCASMQGILQS